MDTHDYDLICIGCGPAGEKAATQAAYFKHRAAIVERNPRPGGAMVNTGTIPSKALRETALLCSAFRRRPLPGTEFAIDHDVSVPSFMARRHIIEHQEHDRIESSLDRHDIDVHRGHGRLADAHTVVVECADGSTATLRARYILVATGSAPLRPDHVPFSHPNVVDADGVLEMEHLPASMIIVGGGVIGCEYASVLAEMDVRVTLVHPHPEILPFIDTECREHLLRAMRDRGIDLRLGESVDTVVAESGDRIRVNCASGDSITADSLLWAAGRSANTADLGLEAVGVELGTRGLIVVDEHLRTNIESIYAAGDVIGFPALASTSMEQGRVAACDMFDIDFKRRVADAIPIGLYTIPAISTIGETEKTARDEGRDIVVGSASYRHNVRGRMLGDADGLVKCVFDRRTHALLGASIVGEDATELIHLAQLAISHGAGIEYFTSACFNYPSLSELYKYAAYAALQSIARQEGRRDRLTGVSKVA